MPYLMEAFVNGQPHHAVLDDLRRAWECAWLMVMTRIWSSEIDEKTAERVKKLFHQDKHREAVALWSSGHPDWLVALYEIEVLKRNCHHDPMEAAEPGIYYLVESRTEEPVPSHELAATTGHALLWADLLLGSWTGRNPKLRQSCSKATRREVRRMLRERQYADAIDAWTAGGNPPSIAIHKIRILKGLIDDVPTNPIHGDEMGHRPGQGEVRHAIPAVRPE
jgi:hypothetical protein